MHMSWEWDGGNHTNIHKNINSGISQGDIVWWVNIPAVCVCLFIFYNVYTFKEKVFKRTKNVKYF